MYSLELDNALMTSLENGFSPQTHFASLILIEIQFTDGRSSNVEIDSIAY